MITDFGGIVILKILKGIPRSNVGNSYGCSAAGAFVARRSSAKRQRAANSPEGSPNHQMYRGTVITVPYIEASERGGKNLPHSMELP